MHCSSEKKGQSQKSQVKKAAALFTNTKTHLSLFILDQITQISQKSWTLYEHEEHMNVQIVFQICL